MGDLESFIGDHLGLSDPWKVTDVSVTEGPFGPEDHIHVDIPFGKLVVCPCCGKQCKVHDRSEERVWRNLDIMSRRTYVHARVPRADCPSCGVRQVDVPWARKNSRFTLEFESMVLALIRSMSVAEAARALREIPNRLWRIVSAAADTLRDGSDLSRVRCIGVDEKCFSGHDGYISVFVDLETRRIIYATEGKGKDAVYRFSLFLREHGGTPSRIRDFTCDFGLAYISGIRLYFRNARITVDPFHLMQMANRALNDVKCKEYPQTVSRIKARYILLRRGDSLDENQQRIREEICMNNEKLGFAYRLKESLSMVYSFGDRETARNHLEGWIRVAGGRTVRRFNSLARTVEHAMEYILNWYDSHLTNAVLEGTNSLISVIRRRSRGFRTSKNLIDICYLTTDKRHTDIYGRSINQLPQVK